MLPKGLSRLRSVSISDTNVVKVDSMESLTSIDILSGITLDRKYNYINILGVVVSGVWTIPSGTPGGATIALCDKRIKGRTYGSISELRVTAANPDFQVKFVPNYPVCMEDAVKKPWELYVRLVGIPVEPGYRPLAIEVAVLIEQCETIITKGLRARILHAAVGDVDGVGLTLPETFAEDVIDNVPVSNSIVTLRNKKTLPKGQSEKTQGGKKNLKSFRNVVGKEGFVSDNVLLNRTNTTMSDSDV